MAEERFTHITDIPFKILKIEIPFVNTKTSKNHSTEVLIVTPYNRFKDNDQNVWVEQDLVGEEKKGVKKRGRNMGNDVQPAVHLTH